MAKSGRSHTIAPGDDYTIDYRVPPTIGRFMASKAHVRGLMGPYRSGKSSGCCMFIFDKCRTQRPQRDGIRRSKWAIVRNCYDDETEILTESRGWRLFKDLAPEDKVATLGADGEISYQLPERVHSAPYKGEMIGFENEGVDFLVTPDHKMYVSKTRTRAKIRSEYEEKSAEEIFGKSGYRVKRDAKWNGTPTDLSENVFEWLGFWFADGSDGVYGGYPRCTITSVKDIEYAREVFTRAGIGWSEWKRSDGGINFVADQKNDTFRKIAHMARGKEGSRAIPPAMKSAPAGHLARFIKGFAKGDGHTRKDSITQTLYTSSRRLADDLQEIALKAGRVANISSRDRIGNAVNIGGSAGVVNHVEYTVTLLGDKKHHPMLHVNKKDTNHLKGWYKRQYDGMVYCVEMSLVPVYVRRNGKAFWCYRTYPELLSTALQTWLKWFPEEHFGDLVRSIPITYFLKFEDVWAEIIFLALDQPGDVKKLQSLELTAAWVNEAREVPKIIIDHLQGRVGQYPSKDNGGTNWSGMIMDTNPPDEDHWWPKMFGDAPPDEQIEEVFSLDDNPEIAADPNDFELFKQPSGLSPEAENIENINDGRLYYLRLARNKDRGFANVYVHGQYGSSTGEMVVYPQFRENIHVSKEPLKFDPRLPLYLGWDFGLCYDDQTEVLTADGWKFFRDVDERKDRAATRNPQTGEMEYTPINFKVDRPYEGEMLEWAGTEVNFCVTPEHRVPYTHRDHPDEVRFAEARWLAENLGRHHMVDLVSEWTAPDFDPAAMYFGMDARTFAEFMGLYLSEGCIGAGYDKRISIYQNERRHDWEEILERTGLPWCWHQYGKTGYWRVNAPHMAVWLRKIGKASEKHVPKSIKAMPADYIRAFIATYTAGDGHIRTRANGAVEHTIFTSSRLMADDLQELAQKAGWNGAIRRVAPQVSMLVEGTVVRAVTGSGGYSITFKKRALRAELHRRNFRRIQYSGRIYCLNVPYHTLYVRRNGKAHWNGNTPACICFQVTPRGQLRVLKEIIGREIGVRRFAKTVVRWHLNRDFAGAEIISTGDPSGGFRKDTDESTCLQVLREEGIPTQAAYTNAFEARKDAVCHYLDGLVEGEPAYIMDPSCKVLKYGFLRGYRYKRIRHKDGDRFVNVVDKGNPYSHPHDGLQYGCLRVRKYLKFHRILSRQHRNRHLPDYQLA